MDDPILEELTGETVSLSMEGQTTQAMVSSVRSDHLVVRVPLSFPATQYEGVIGKIALPDGRELRFDVGRHGSFIEMELKVPLTATQPVAEAAPAIERRKFYRLACELDLEIIEPISYGKAGGKKGFGSEIIRTRGRTINVSGGGLLCKLDQPLMPGVYAVRLHLPDETLSLSAKVIRKPLASPVFTAMEFAGINEMDRSKVIRLIFNRMRHVKDTVQKDRPKTSSWRREEPSRHQIRREKYYAPPKTRYW